MLSPKELLDEYFVENRNRLLEVAAFLDRMERAGQAHTSTDFRARALREAILTLASPSPNHVDQIQQLLSDPTTEPIPVLDRKSALGAYDRWSQEVRP